MIHIYDANAWLRRSLNRNSVSASTVDPRVLYYTNICNPETEIWVWDGANNNERRRKLFAPYKIRDYDGQENIFAGLQIYRELLEHSRAMQVEIAGWEADDVCATLAKRYASQGEAVTVYTNDLDYQQLLQFPNITLKGFKLDPDIPPRFISLYKALVGDKSDKIPGIPGFGPGAFKGLRDLWPVLDKALRERDIATFRAQPWKPSINAWLADDANAELVCTFHQITQMLDVPIDEINANLKIGVINTEAAEALFARFMF